MSYARMGCDGSDVYVYDDCGGGITCLWCRLVPEDVERTNLPTYQAMIEHLLEHRSRGHHVPESAMLEIAAMSRKYPGLLEGDD